MHCGLSLNAVASIVALRHDIGIDNKEPNIIALCGLLLDIKYLNLG